MHAFEHTLGLKNAKRSHVHFLGKHKTHLNFFGWTDTKMAKKNTAFLSKTRKEHSNGAKEQKKQNKPKTFKQGHFYFIAMCFGYFRINIYFKTFILFSFSNVSV